MTDRTVIYRADVIGSLLRPPWLVQARNDFRAGSLDRQQYMEVEDRAVDEGLRIQESAGVDVVSDGEMRRDIFCDLFVKGMEGFSQQHGYTAQFRSKDKDVAMEVTMPFTVTGKIKRHSSPSLDEFLASKDRTDKPLKMALPSPTLIGAYWSKDGSKDAYGDPFELFADAAEALRDWAGELFEAGCPYIQIDAPEFNQVFADQRIRDEYTERGIDVERFKAEGAELLGRVASVRRPAGSLLGLHVCKGNGTQSWLAEGGYEDICREVFRRADGFDVFLMEYDDGRSGSFEPLRHLPDDKIAVLGLVSSKWQTLEEPGALRGRIEEAARFHPKDRLALTTQCGFASASETAEQRLMTDEVQAAKLKLVADVAHAIWD